LNEEKKFSGKRFLIGGDRRKIGEKTGWVGRNAEGWDKWDFNNF
jgi:hypothetical protein